jgi:hypothetical protein
MNGITNRLYTAEGRIGEEEINPKKISIMQYRRIKRWKCGREVKKLEQKRSNVVI